MVTPSTSVGRARRTFPLSRRARPASSSTSCSMAATRCPYPAPCRPRWSDAYGVNDVGVAGQPGLSAVGLGGEDHRLAATDQVLPRKVPGGLAPELVPGHLDGHHPRYLGETSDEAVPQEAEGFCLGRIGPGGSLQPGRFTYGFLCPSRIVLPAGSVRYGHGVHDEVHPVPTLPVIYPGLAVSPGILIRSERAASRARNSPAARTLTCFRPSRRDLPSPLRGIEKRRVPGAEAFRNCGPTVGGEHPGWIVYGLNHHR